MKIVDRTAARTGVHVHVHRIPSVTLVMHGGESLLAIGPAVQVNAGVQTNGSASTIPICGSSASLASGWGQPGWRGGSARPAPAVSQRAGQLPGHGRRPGPTNAGGLPSSLQRAPVHHRPPQRSGHHLQGPHRIRSAPGSASCCRTEHERRVCPSVGFALAVPAMPVLPHPSGLRRRALRSPVSQEHRVLQPVGVLPGPLAAHRPHPSTMQAAIDELRMKWTPE
jgi:hypothetical protein